MPIMIRDQDVEKRVGEESRRRGHNTLARTASALLIERLSQIEDSQPQASPPPPQHQEQSDAIHRPSHRRSRRASRQAKSADR